MAWLRNVLKMDLFENMQTTHPRFAGKRPTCHLTGPLAGNTTIKGVTWANCKDSDQTAHPRCPIRVFAVSMGNLQPTQSPKRPKITDYRTDLYFFTPKFLQWTLPSLNLDASIIANRDINQKSRSKWHTVWILMRRLVTSRLIRIYTFVHVHVLFRSTGLKVWNIRKNRYVHTM